MEILSDIRYWLGVLVLATWLPAISSWIIIHPLAFLTRKIVRSMN